jgi:hypothetical protein
VPSPLFHSTRSRHLERRRERVVDAGHARQRAAGHRHRPHVAETIGFVEQEDEFSRARHDIPAGSRCRWDRVVPVGELLECAGGNVNLEDLAVHAHVDDGEDRASVGRPGGAIELVRKIGEQRARRSAGSRNDEQVLLEVRLEVRARRREEEHL